MKDTQDDRRASVFFVSNGREIKNHRWTMVSSHLRSSFIFCWWWYFCHLTLAQAEGSASACIVQKTLWAGRLESLAWPTTTRRNPVKQERRL